MVKLLFTGWLFVLASCCPKQQIIYYPKDITNPADTIQTFLVEPYWWIECDDSTYKLIKIEYDDFSSKDTIVRTDTVISIIEVPVIK